MGALNEVGPCTLKADGSASPAPEPEAEPRNGRLRTAESVPEPESAPTKLSPESELELMQILEEQAALRARLESLLGSKPGPRPEPEPEPEAESEPEIPRGSSVPVVKSREPH